MDKDDFITYKRQNSFAEVEVDGRSPAILLIHGFGGSPFDYKPVEENLRKSGYAFKSILLPGHGTNPKDLQNTQMSDWLAKSFSEYDRLKGKYGGVSVVGFSMGEKYRYVLQQKNQLKSWFLSAPILRSKNNGTILANPNSGHED